MSDRGLQDDVIRALADASFRRSPAWRDRDLADAQAVERFSRFLARNFYRNRVIHFFKYSRALARVTGRLPQAAIDTEGFERVLPGAVIGSRATAVEVAGLVVEDQRAAPGADRVPYLGDLLAYQEAMMVAEAGPRDWTGTEERRPTPEQAAAEIAEGTSVLELAHDLPAVLPRLLLPFDEVPEAPRRPVRLMVARSRQGRVSVAVLTPGMERALGLLDGRRTLAELGHAAGEDLVLGLLDLGAIRVSSGS